MTHVNTASVPLTGWQKARLIFDCLPFAVFVVILVISMVILPNLVGAIPLAFYLFMGLVILVVGFQVVQRFHDLISGMAVVEEDVLERSWRSGGGGRAMYFGKFERMGRLRLIAKAHFQSHNGVRYRVTYSPASKIMWKLEPLS